MFVKLNNHSLKIIKDQFWRFVLVITLNIYNSCLSLSLNKHTGILANNH